MKHSRKKTDNPSPSLPEEDFFRDQEAKRAKATFVKALEKERQKQSLSKVSFSRKMERSLTFYSRLVDDSYTGSTVKSMSRAAVSLGKRLCIDLKDPEE